MLFILPVLLVALGVWWVVGWVVDRDLATDDLALGSASDDDTGSDGFAPAALRRRYGWLWWRGGALFMEGGQRWWESRLLHRQVPLTDARLVDVRRSRGGGWFIRATDGHTRLVFEVGEQQYLLIVPTEQASWAASSVAAASD